MIADRQYKPSALEFEQRFIDIYCKGCTKYEGGACPILAQAATPAGSPQWRITVDTAVSSCNGFIPIMVAKSGNLPL